MIRDPLPRASLALDADRVTWAGFALSAVALGLAWWAWVVWGAIAVFERVDGATVRAEGAATVVTPAEGEVVAMPFSVGDRVERGALLLQLDDADLRLAVEAGEARLRGFEAQLEALEAADLAETTSVSTRRRASSAEIAVARSALDEAGLLLTEARAELAQVEALVAKGAASADAAARAATEVAVREARVRGLEREVARISGQAAVSVREDEAATRRRASGLAALVAERIATERDVERLRAQLLDRAITAPVGGVVVDRPAWVEGMRVPAGAVVAVVVPEGPVEVVGRLAAERAVGRVQPGQQARVQVRGRLGSVGAHVARVGQEPDPEGAVAVWLRPAASLEHGLVVDVVIEVETVRPLDVWLRTLGMAP